MIQNDEFGVMQIYVHQSCVKKPLGSFSFSETCNGYIWYEIWRQILFYKLKKKCAFIHKANKSTPICQMGFMHFHTESNAFIASYALRLVCY